jgi:predicted tellurium resistance membrane protein TerC
MSFVISVLAIEEAILVLGIAVMVAIIVMAVAFWRMAGQFKKFNTIYLYYKKEERKNAQNPPPPPKNQ